MDTRDRSLRLLLLNLLAVLALLLGSWATPALAQDAGAADTASPAVANAPENLVVMYSAKFVCTEALKPGQFFYGVAAPIVQQSTDVLVHNPNGFPVRLFKKAVVAPLEEFAKVEQGEAPGKWKAVTLAPDYAFRIDCDDIAKLLTGNAAATFFGAYGYKTVEGFVVIGIGQQQPVAGSNLTRFAPLDVTAEYVRSSEVMKKDIHLQPWWRWWWGWQLPWRLGYPYRRILRLQPGAVPVNLDLRQMLVAELKQELANSTGGDPREREATMAALDNGLKLELEPHTTNAEANVQDPALVLIMSDPQYIGGEGALSVDFVIVSNKSPSDPNPLDGSVANPVSIRYPWIPGHWYNLPLLMPQNVNIDLHHHIVRWHGERWQIAGKEAGVNVDAVAVNQNLVYWFPYWCGWGNWWWGWRGTDCIDIGVGEGESLDVEQVTPVRVFMPQWPPVVQ